ncbi:MAG: hypothetical protein HXY40_06195 [Chloroflexi bacterium]|nr:hypothetical protein [Chloroflexota bacterium]
MGRVINPDTTGKRRNQLMRSSAEMLRMLTQKTSIDDESKDMLAALVYNLREIDAGIEQSAEAWEKRDYWMKAEELRRRWTWPGYMAGQLSSVLVEDKWEALPQIMVKLLPHFADIKITKITSKEGLWLGSYKRLLEEKTSGEKPPK